MAPPSNQLRIIGGALRGRRLAFGDAKGLRPTADRLRETLFNWLQADIDGSVCLDMFAGSGALGIEALSRGARDVVFVERARPPALTLRQNLVALGLARRARVINADARALLRRPPATLAAEPFDIVFLDPPFASGFMTPAVEGLSDHGLVREGGLVYQEQDAGSDWGGLPDGWTELKTSRAGQAMCRLVRVAKAGGG